MDLHLHTTVSDGRLTPTELIQLVAERGLETIAITDHDITDGLEEAYEAAKAFPNLRLIPGIEISTDLGEHEIHLLGYFLQTDHPGLQENADPLPRGTRGPRATNGGEAAGNGHHD